MDFPRASGILLHPSSLPGPDGIGDIGPAAHRWLEWLNGAGQRLWQVLPLSPTGFGDSPYQSFSAFAGNPYLISAEALRSDRLLRDEDLADRPSLPGDRVDYGPVIEWKLRLLARAFARFEAGAAPGLRRELGAFEKAQAGWLDDYALFMALKAEAGGVEWTRWPRPLALRERDAIAAARARLAGPVAAQRFAQFVFFRQWAAVRERARALDVRIVGDVPIFVAHDSADVWAHRDLFQLDDDGRPTVVAGVPPDYFSATGQLWGNPLYRWERLAADGYAWWIERLSASLECFDIVRIDHFRGFESYWEIPAGDPTAERGRWVKGPADALFEAVRAALGELPIVAEDLGFVTPEVMALRDRLGFPGMKILQFGFASDADDPFLPHNFTSRCVAYTGTHDNETARGWYEQEATEKEKDHARRYLKSDGHDFAWDLIRATLASVAGTAIVPLQDVLDRGPAARMNLPGRPHGNWSWRFRWEEIPSHVPSRLEDLTELYGR